jgi:hypothetical protein
MGLVKNLTCAQIGTFFRSVDCVPKDRLFRKSYVVCACRLYWKMLWFTHTHLYSLGNVSITHASKKKCVPLPTSLRISIMCICRQAYLALEVHEYDTWVRLHAKTLAVHLPRAQGKAVSKKVYGYKETMVVLDQEPKSSNHPR